MISSSLSAALLSLLRDLEDLLVDFLELDFLVVDFEELDFLVVFLVVLVSTFATGASSTTASTFLTVFFSTLTLVPCFLIYSNVLIITNNTATNKITNLTPIW